MVAFIHESFASLQITSRRVRSRRGFLRIVQGTRAVSKDPSVGRTDQIEGQDIQKRLAISLVFNLGFEGAVHSCQANSWEGVLKWVIVLRETG